MVLATILAMTLLRIVEFLEVWSLKKGSDKIGVGNLKRQHL
jgi:hypothetical protein